MQPVPADLQLSPHVGQSDALVSITTGIKQADSWAGPTGNINTRPINQYTLLLLLPIYFITYRIIYKLTMIANISYLDKIRCIR